MPVLIDIHLLVQAILYFVSVACGLVVAIPLGVTRVNLKGKCLLYTECTWQNKTHFTTDLTSGRPCDFAVNLSVLAGILFSAGMGTYYIYALTRKDPNIGSQMWVLPFTLISSVVAVAYFITACVISVGFKEFCDSYMKGKDKGAMISSCADGQRDHWHDKNNETMDGSTYYNYIHASEGAAWVMVIVWVAQMALGILRIFRNRRLRSQGMFADGGAPGGDKKAEDMQNVAAANPSA